LNPILAVTRDLFFRGKITAVAAQIGADVRFVPAGALLARVAADAPELVIVDLNGGPGACDAISELRRSGVLVPVLGFYGHVHEEARAKALASGFTRVIPNSAFDVHLGEILAGRF
jgi:CheY-like chemotaxis protein